MSRSRDWATSHSLERPTATRRDEMVRPFGAVRAPPALVADGYPAVGFGCVVLVEL